MSLVEEEPTTWNSNCFMHLQAADGLLTLIVVVLIRGFRAMFIRVEGKNIDYQDNRTLCMTWPTDISSCNNCITQYTCY